MTPCIEHAQKGRYARVRRNGRLVAQHVAVWEEAYGPKPEGWEVDHLCHNMRCIRLDHLEAVTHLENTRRSRATRLTIELVRQMRVEYAALPRGERRSWRKRKTDRPVKVKTGARQALAEKYGVTPDYLKKIVTERVWPD